MLRTIALIPPIFVSLLWSVTLAGKAKKYSNPRVFLAWFMLLPLVIFVSHFIYLAPLPAIFPYFDIVLQSASLLVFPAYYIYFRLLTVDDNFSIKAHYKYFIASVLLSLVYAVAVLLTPNVEYRAWLFDELAFPESPYIQLLGLLRIINRLTYLTLVVLTVLGNSVLIHKYGSKAEHYYSDIEDGKYNNAKMLNYSIIVMSVGAFVFTALGRQFLLSKDLIISLGWSVFTIMLFIIGYMGSKQKPINPTLELDNINANSESDYIDSSSENMLLEKILSEFEQNKIYLNIHLNILDLVRAVGSNRTYISTLINQQYSQNFCSFVNAYRLEELERVFLENPSLSNEKLAERCGFGSLNSMKRAIKSHTEQSIPEWKNNIYKINLTES